MKQKRLADALGQIDDRYIIEAMPQASVRKTKKRLPLFRAAAVLATIIMLAVPVRAELATGYVSNLLAPLYGGAQTKLVDQIGVPVGADATVGDYKLSADAVIGDKYNIAIVYSLTRTDGGILEEELRFEDYSNTAKRGSGGGSYSFHLSEDRTRLSIVEQWTSSQRLKRKAEVTFTNLISSDPETKETRLIQEGEWILKFTIRYEDASVKVPAGNTIVEDAAGRKHTIHRILLSPIGLHLDLTIPKTHSRLPSRDFTISLILNDGTMVDLEDKNFGAHGNMEAETHKANVGAMFDQPVPLEQIKAVVICGTTFPL